MARLPSFVGIRNNVTISRLVEVDVGIAERPLGDQVPAHPDGVDGTGRGELLEEC